jgi:RNA polymerase sigma-70 factor, ECF subfamily
MSLAMRAGNAVGGERTSVTGDAGRAREAEPTTAELVGRARGGDRRAFGALYERYARMVHGLLLAHADRSDVEDLVQDVFVAAMERLGSLREPAAFGGWVATIARNRARMHHRARRPTEALAEEMPGTSRTDQGLAAAEILAALRRIPERYREPLVLRLVEEMSGEEIALRTGLTHGTVRVYLHHGMMQLRSLLGGSDA